MADKTIDVIPVGKNNGATFKKIKLTDKGDYFEVYRDGDTYVGQIQEQAEIELWEVRVSSGPVFYAKNRAVAAELACVLYSYIKKELW